MEFSWTELWTDVQQVFSEALFKVGNTPITTWTLFTFFGGIVFVIYLSGLIKRILVKKILLKNGIDIGVSQSIGTIVKYFILVIGLLVVVQSSGIDLSALSILAGALGVGIGFGLQNVTNNFISGIIILFERPIKVGDRIEVGDVNGDVVKIASRSTTVVTNDNIAIIIPNSDFINQKVINWSYNDRNVRFRFPVGVAYKEDPEVIKRLLLEVAEKNSFVLRTPAPDVIFDSYGDSSLNFMLYVWTSEYVNKSLILRSQLYYEIFKKFKENNIEIPFPQRDIHIRSGFKDEEKN